MIPQCVILQKMWWYIIHVNFSANYIKLTLLTLPDLNDFNTQEMNLRSRVQFTSFHYRVSEVFVPNIIK